MFRFADGIALVIKNEKPFGNRVKRDVQIL